HRAEAVVEREALTLGVQGPVRARPLFAARGPAVYRDPLPAAVRTAIAEAGGVASATSGPVWVQRIRDHCPDLAASALVSQLAVEPLRLDGPPDPRYVRITLARLELPTVEARVAELMARVQRMNPLTDKDEYLARAPELFALQQHARALRELTAGEL